MDPTWEVHLLAVAANCEGEAKRDAVDRWTTRRGDYSDLAAIFPCFSFSPLFLVLRPW